MYSRFSNICTVTMFVGKERTRFDVHQDQLCEVSTFFKAAFTSQYKESSKKTIELLEDDVDTVDLFVQWLYKQQCDLWSAPVDDESDLLMQPIRLLVFADKYDVSSLKLYTFKELLAHSLEEGSEAPSEDVVKYAYNNTCRGSGIRTLLADWYALWNGAKWYQFRSTQRWLLRHPEFAVDLVIAFSNVSEACHLPNPLRNNKPEHYMDVQEDISSSESSSDESTE